MARKIEEKGKRNIDKERKINRETIEKERWREKEKR